MLGGFSGVSVLEPRYVPYAATGALRTVVARQSVTGPVGNAVTYAWPAGAESIEVHLDVSEFLDPAKAILVTITSLWDDGRVVVDRTPIPGGAREAKTGAAPMIALGPTRGFDGTLQGKLDNPQRVRIGIESALGAPRVGLLSNVSAVVP